MGSRSGSSGVQFAFSWTQFSCVPESERIAARGAQVACIMGGSGSSGFTQCSVVEENEVCSFWRMKEAGYDEGWGNCWRSPSTLHNSAIFLVGLHLLFVTFTYLPFFYYFISILFSPFFPFQILLSLFPSVLFPLTPFFLFLFWFCFCFFLATLCLLSFIPPIHFLPWSIVLPLCSLLVNALLALLVYFSTSPQIPLLLF